MSLTDSPKPQESAILVATNLDFKVRLFYCSNQTKSCREIIEINGVRLDACQLTTQCTGYKKLIKLINKVNLNCIVLDIARGNYQRKAVFIDR